jgi:hypothetical protein
VDGAVLLEAAALLERLAAHVANARADLGKVAEAVVAQVRPLAERLAADVARHRALSANRHHTPPISSHAASVSRAAGLGLRQSLTSQLRVFPIADFESLPVSSLRKICMLNHNFICFSPQTSQNNRSTLYGEVFAPAKYFFHYNINY